MLELTEEEVSLSKRALSCANWRWKIGMRGGVPGDWYRACDQSEKIYWHGETNGGWTIEVGSDWIPDFRDAATLGCLLEIVREISGDPWLYVYVRSRADGSEHEWTGTVWDERFSADSEEGVLVKMLESLNES
jgi:hypothetical protein